MKGHHIYKTIPATFFLLCAIVCNAQLKTTVRASVDKTNILIGEQINLVIETNIPENEPIGFYSPDSIAHFEFIRKSKIDTANTNKGTILKQLFRITSFDSGQWVIPAYSLPQSDNLKTDSIIINVGYLPMDSTKDYNDIKEIIEVNVKKHQDWTWYYVGGGILLLVLLVYLLTKKKKKQEALIAKEAEKIIDPYTAALEGLEKLQGEGLIAKGETKQYYSRVTDIFRVYVEKKKNIQSLQQTTDDLVAQLGAIKLERTQYDQLAQALRLSDFVKFAKYIPTEEDHKNVFETIKKSITVIEKMNQPAVAGSN